MGSSDGQERRVVWKKQRAEPLITRALLSFYRREGKKRRASSRNHGMRRERRRATGFQRDSLWDFGRFGQLLDIYEVCHFL
ncbi:hypothetical protein KFK09_014350 [Dendrobium nobile]|uniref:Uncharacterized protein n=1 Tax=Dendrobium nobile TaxID=94219 RepID=A0A8T3BBG4_DENNO|nr:hypothetical protein KFK09_014350 [Dendrobium nobile]